MKHIFLISSLLFVNLVGVFAQGYEIEVKFNVYQDTVILGHHRANQLIPDDTVVTDKNGKAVFRGKEALPGGMYFVFFSNKRFFDMLIDEDQQFTVSGDTADFSKIEFKGDPQNSLFISYQNEMRKLSSQLRELQQQRATADDKAAIDAEMQALRDDLETLYQETITKNPGSFFTVFLKATRDPQVPETVTGQKERYFYYRNHYFDNFDYGDSRLLRTPLYEGKIETYLDKLLPQVPDTLIEAVDKLVEASRGDDEHFQYMLVHVFNKYASSQLMAAENVYVHLAEKYYIDEASWSSPEFISDLKDRVSKKKKCLVGAKSHDIEYFLLPPTEKGMKKMAERSAFYKGEGLEAEKITDENQKHNKKVEILSRWTAEDAVRKRMHDMSAKFIIIWFWTPDCSHCREATPEFYKAYTEKKLKEKGVEVLAVYLNKDIKDWTLFEKEHKRWLDFIIEHKMYDWNNAWNPFDPFRSNYDINSSPVLYMIDNEKKIVAKRIGWEQAIEVIEAELEHGGK